MIVRMAASHYDSLRNEPRQPAAHRGTGSDIEEKELFQGEWVLLLLGVPDLDHDVEIDQGFKERQLRSFKLPDLFQSGK